MNIIRQILKDKEQNINDLNASIEEVEKLINELKIAEVNIERLEAHVVAFKTMISEMESLAPAVADGLDEFNSLNDVCKTSDLEPLHTLLQLMKDHPDYSDDQGETNNHLNQVKQLIDKQDSISDRVASQADFIKSIVENQNDNYKQIDDPENFLRQVKGSENTLKTGIEQINEISSRAAEIRSQLQDAYINRNFTAKSEQFDEFQVRVVSLKEKLEIIQSRVENEKADPNLDDYHKQNLEEIEEILNRRQLEIEQLDNKAEDDQKLVNEIVEKMDSVGDLAETSDLPEL